MALYDYPFPSYSWPYQGVDFAVIGNMSQDMADQMYLDGIRFIGRYLFAQQFPYGKGISATEASYYLNAGISIFFYYEVSSNDALGGYSRGYQNGQNCLLQCQALGVPAGTQIYCCCDTGVTDSQAAGVVMDYLRGFKDALPGYSIGIYGGQNVMEACYSADPNYYRVQAGAWGAKEFSPINVRQWPLAYNGNANRDGYINIANITISGGYAYWRGYNVDLCSAPDLTNMWNSGSPGPTPPIPPVPPGPGPEDKKMPIWMYLKPF